MSSEQWPPLDRAVDALRARARHGTVMPFGRRKAARVLAEHERLVAEVERLQPLHEIECPQCGATIRARMADAPEPPAGARDVVERPHGYGDFTPPGKGAPSCTCKCGATSGPVESDRAAQLWWRNHRTEVEEDRRRP